MQIGRSGRVLHTENSEYKEVNCVLSSMMKIGMIGSADVTYLF